MEAPSRALFRFIFLLIHWPMVYLGRGFQYGMECGFRTKKAGGWLGGFEEFSSLFSHESASALTAKTTATAMMATCREILLNPAQTLRSFAFHEWPGLARGALADWTRLKWAPVRPVQTFSSVRRSTGQYNGPMASP